MGIRNFTAARSNHRSFLPSSDFDIDTIITKVQTSERGVQHDDYFATNNILPETSRRIMPYFLFA